MFSSIRNGVYRVEAELSGFKKAIREGIDRPGQYHDPGRSRSSTVGAVAETVTVVGESPLLQTDRTDTGRIIESMLLQEVPLAWNRNFQGALITVPGATRPHRVHSEFFNAQDSLSIEVNGQSRLANNVLLDGIDNNHKTGLLTVLIPSADAIEPSASRTSNYDAEFGRAGGAVTAVTLKSGTNQFKGSATFGGNTDATDRDELFQRHESADEDLGYTLHARRSDPSDRTFFFGDYQRAIDNAGRVQRSIIPPMEFRNGDFSRASTIVYNPFTGNADGTGRQPFAGQRHSGVDDQPDRAAYSRADSRAEHRRRRLGQINYQINVSAREDDRRVRREDQSSGLG